MIYFPSLSGKQKSATMIEDFRGYNANRRISDGEFSSMKNMSSDKYPILSPRGKRKRVRAFTAPKGLYMHNSLCWVDGAKFYYGGVEKGTLYIGTDPYTDRTMIGMGAYVLIFPDKKYYNSGDDSFGSLEQTNTITATKTITLTNVTGTAYSITNTTASATAPTPAQGETLADGTLWIDTSSVPHVLKKYASSSGLWVQIATTYVKIAATGIGTGLQANDGVTISGFTGDFTSLNGEFVLVSASANEIVVTAILDEVGTQSGSTTVSRTVPTMDYVTELNNRIWGCSNANHEIYTCKLGDPKVWKQFLNVSTDSFAVTIGSKGNFTGAVTQLGSVLFFKEDIIHELYGSKPSNFQIQDNNVRGVKAGCAKSLAVVNETLFYVSKQDVCSFGTSVPRQISYALGGMILSDAVGAACGCKYYLSAKDSTNTYHLLVYDFEKDMWHIEDNTQIKYAATVGNDLYFIAANNIMYAVNGYSTTYDDASAAAESDIEWSAEFGDMGLDSPNRKYVSKLQFRMKVKQPALVCISVMYDNSGSWEEVYHASVTTLNSFVANIIPRRCDTMRVKIHGTGEFELYSIAKSVEGGSEV